jgi:hypothetical protein
MKHTVDWMKFITICATLLIGASGTTYAFITGWRTAETLLQYLAMSAATAFYVAGAGSIIYGSGYIVWLRASGRSTRKQNNGQPSESG